ncbi:MAG: LLM class F420-dependent oxidoreductase [Candidatus Binatia bacterium]
MKLGLHIGYWGLGLTAQQQLELVLEAERLGYDSVWTAEAYGSDAATILAWLAQATSTIKLGSAIFQMPGRSAAMTAMTAATIDHLSGGRLILGLGVSGPQVVEGWYGQPFEKPMARTREFVTLVREMLRREGPVRFAGKHYRLPYDGAGSTGLGKPLKLIMRPRRSEVPIYMGAEGPKNVALAAEIADGWLPIFYSPFRSPALYAESLENAKPGFDVACMAQVHVSDDVASALVPVKWMLGFYIGGMGAEQKNFHLNLIARMGFENEAMEVQKLFREGKRAEAAAAVPDALADEISLVGPRERIRDRLDAWKESPVRSILLATRDPAALRTMAELAL